MAERKHNGFRKAPFSTQNHSEEILAILRGEFTVEKLKDYHEKDIAEAFAILQPDERKRLYGVLSVDTLASIFEYCDETHQFLHELPAVIRADVLSVMEATESQAYLQQLDDEEKNELLSLMKESSRFQVTLLDTFEPDEVGSRMSVDYIHIPVGLTVREAMRSLVKQAEDCENISTIYVVDDNGLLFGAIDLQALIIVRENTPLEHIILTQCPYVFAREKVEDCIERIKEYSESSIPVLDSNKKLCGVLTANEIAELVDEEISDDYAKLAGLSAEEDLNEPLKRSVGKRLPWLMILMGLGLLVSTVVGLFEGIIAHLTVIISFQSLILDMAGNVGTQSLAVTIRVLMDEQINGKDKLRLIWKEAKVGVVNGALLGILSVVLIGGYLVLLKGQSTEFAFAVSACTAIALLVAIIFSSICGTVVPMLFQKLKVDPAVASGPLITTVNDLIAVVTYYGLAWVLLIRVLNL